MSLILVGDNIMLKKILICFSWLILGVFIIIDIDIALDSFKCVPIFDYLGLGKYISELMIIFLIIGIPIIIVYTVLMFFKFSMRTKIIFSMIILNSIFIIWFMLVIVQQNIV